MAKAKKAKAKSGGDPLAPVKKNAFWIGLGLILIVGIVCYFLGSGKVSAERAANLSKIKALSTEVASAVPKDALADKGREKFVEDRLKPTRNQVEQTWKSLYDAQSTVFEWPRQVLGDSGEVLKRGLPSNFIDAVKAMPPIEQLTPKHALDSSLSNIYRNFSRGLVDDLCKDLKATNFLGSAVITADKTATTTAAKAAEKQTEEALAPGDSVLWVKRSQETTREDHFNFKENEPPLVDILHAQEDYWVYKALFLAIANTNDPEGALGKAVETDIKAATKADDKGAAKTPAPKTAKPEPKAEKKTEPKGAGKEGTSKRLEPVIKKVLDVRIGDRYESPKGSIEVKRVERADDGGAGAQGEAPAEEKLTTIWLQEAQKRYVNENDEPLKVAEVNALKDGQMEYKRMPVHLKLEMDQRAIGDFFVACMQSPVKIEWRQLTVTADPQYQRSKPIGSDPAAGGQQTKEATEKKGFFDSTLELYGVVYIIYPPKLPATEPAAEAPAQEQPADAPAQPADATKAGAETAKATQ
jgi:hypothetical protein